MENQTESFILFESDNKHDWLTLAFWDHPATYMLLTMLVMRFMGF